MKKIYHHPEIVEITEFFDKTYCGHVIEYLNGNGDGEERWNPICFPSVLGVNVGEPVPTEHISVEDMGKIRDKMHGALEDFLQKPIKNVTLSGHKFPKGSFAAPHSDSSELDGTPNAWQMNKYASILYLNDDYEGGEIYFPQHDVSIFPGAGSLLVFKGSHEFLHGVKEITRGDRYTLLGFWDDRDTKYSKEFLDQKVELQKKALDYVESNYDYGKYAGNTFGKQNPDDLYSVLGEKL
jgi:hypothetical protein